MALKVGELFASFNLDTSGIDGAVKSAENKMANLGKSLAIGGAAMTAAVTVPLKKAASAIFEAGSGFDAQMSKVFAIAGDEVTGSADAMEALRQKALEMGSTTQFTASEAGEAMEYMAMAGWKTDQMLAAIGPLMNLAAAAGADLGTTSDIVTDAMTAFGYAATDTVTVVKDGVKMEVNAVEHFADVLAAASSNSNTNVTMLGESFKFAAPLAGALGYSVDDVAIALGLMANNGIKSSMAGTSLSRIIQNMAKPSDQTAAAMEALGVSLYNSKGEAKSLREIMGDFRGQAKKNGVDVAKLAADVGELDKQYASGKITEEQYTAKLEELTAGSGDFLKNLTQLAGARGLPGLLAIMNATDEDFEKLCGSIDNATGSASEMKRVMLDNAKGDITLFKSALEGLEITLWGLAENGFRKVVQEATKYVDAFRNADKSTQLGTLKMGALAAAIGPAMAGMGGLVAILPSLAKTFTAVSGPTALLAIGLLALGAAAIDSNNDIGKTFVKGMNRAGQKVRQFGRNVEKQLPTLTANMGKFLNSLSTGIANGLPGIMDGLTSLITTGVQAISANMPKIANVPQTIVTTLANSIKKNAPKIIPAVLDLLTNMATALISNIPVVLEGMGTVISSIITAVSSADWGEIGTKLRAAVEDAIKQAFTVFKKGAMGDKYVEDASWVQVGAAMIENIRDGITKAAQNSKDLLGSLVLGEDYVPDDSWGTVAGKIWNKITTEMTKLLTNAGDLIKGMVLGEDYTADASWGTVATKIWQTIKDKFTTLKANVKDLIGTIALGDDYTADTSWEKVGQAIWNKVKEKITSLTVDAKDLASAFGTIAGDVVTGIAKAIPKALNAAGQVFDAGLMLAGALVDTIVAAFDSFKPELNVGNIVQSLVNNITRAIGGVFDFGGKVVTAGAHIAESLLDSLAGSLDTTINTDGVSVMTGKLKTFLQTLISKIVELVPKLFSTGGKVISAGMKLASELVKSLAEGFANGEGLDIDLAGVASGIVSGIVEAIKNLPELLGDVLSAGAQIANAIMESISNSMVDMESSGVGSTFGTALADLVKGLLGKTSDFSKDENVIGFVKNLGRGIIGALGTIGQVLGSFIGELMKYLFSKEGLTQLYNAGVALMNLLWEGMKSVVGGIVSFFTNLVDEILISWGIIDVDAKETYDAAMTAAESSIGIAKQAFSDALTSYDESAGTGDSDFQNMALLALFGARNGNMGEIVDASNQWTAGFLQIAEDAINASLGDGPHVSMEQWAQNMWGELESAVQGTGEGRTISADAVKGIMEKYLAPLGIELGTLPDVIWESIANNVAMGGLENENELWSIILSSILGDGMLGTSEIEGATDTATAAAEKTLQNMGISTKEAAEEAKDTIVTAMNDSASAMSQNGMAGALADSTEPVSEAALQVSDAVVQQFLLTMSEENGNAIGTQFVSGIIAILEDGTLITVTETLGTDAYNSISNILSGAAGVRIGHNFGLGLGNGIASMTSYVTTAAYNLGRAAANALSSAIQEGSPSKLTAVSGRNFGLGFINLILDSVGDAESAAAMLGVSAASSLEQTISDISGDAADQMSITGSGRRNEAEALAAENEKTAMTYANAIANALNGARVVMNGELVGELVTDTVSEGIASRYAGMRYGTV